MDYKWRGGYCGKKHLIDGHKVLNVGIILGEGGAEYLKLENRSEQVVKFCRSWSTEIGNQTRR